MIVVQALGILALMVAVVILTTWTITGIADWVERRTAARRARIEAELDRKQAALRRTTLTVAEGLARDRDEASRQMTRAAFLATGSTSEPPRS